MTMPFRRMFGWLRRIHGGGRLGAGLTEAAALALIQQTLPPVWADLWTGRETPRTFSLNSWAKPRIYFLDPAGVASVVPGLAGLTPLLEKNGEALIGWLPDGRFVEFYYEDGLKGDAAITTLGRNYQEFVLALLLKLEEIGTRDELLEFGATLRFDHAAALIDVLDRTDAGDEALAVLRDRIAASGRRSAP